MCMIRLKTVLFGISLALWASHDESQIAPFQNIRPSLMQSFRCFFAIGKCSSNASIELQTTQLLRSTSLYYLMELCCLSSIYPLDQSPRVNPFSTSESWNKPSILSAQVSFRAILHKAIFRIRWERRNQNIYGITYSVRTPNLSSYCNLTSVLLTYLIL